MEHRELGRTGRQVSVVGLGTWQLGADWGEVSEADARAVLEEAAAQGVTFYDTADVYGDGRSEQIVGRFLADHADDGFTVATKMGRRKDQVPENYNPDNFRAWIDRSRQQPRRRPARPRAAALPALGDDRRRRDVRRAGRTGRGRLDRGVRRERRDRRPGAERDARDRTSPPCRSSSTRCGSSRSRRCCPTAIETGIGIIARVPLASGLLSGKYDESTTFAQDDHRSYNRDGSAFDVGETFSGVPYDVGLRAAADFTALGRESGPEGLTPAQAAIAWVWQLPGVTTVIPGARNARAGAVQRGGGWRTGAQRGLPGRRRPDLRRAGAGAGARPLVRRDGVRREILWMLWDAELPAGEISAAFDVSGGTVSTHLSALREAGLVAVRADGNFRRYRADRQAMQAVLPLLASTGEQLADRGRPARTGPGGGHGRAVGQRRHRRTAPAAGGLRRLRQRRAVHRVARRAGHA